MANFGKSCFVSPFVSWTFLARSLFGQYVKHFFTIVLAGGVVGIVAMAILAYCKYYADSNASSVIEIASYLIVLPIIFNDGLSDEFTEGGN
jgi:hypothetical protein